MTIAIASVVNTVFNNRALSEDVIYRAGDAGDGAIVRAVIPSKDVVTDFGGAQLVSNTTIFHVRRSEVASPSVGDTIEWYGVRYVVQSEPVRRDSRGLVWQLDAVPA